MSIWLCAPFRIARPVIWQSRRLAILIASGRAESALARIKRDRRTSQHRGYGTAHVQRERAGAAQLGARFGGAGGCLLRRRSAMPRRRRSLPRRSPSPRASRPSSCGCGVRPGARDWPLRTRRSQSRLRRWTPAHRAQPRCHRAPRRARAMPRPSRRDRRLGTAGSVIALRALSPAGLDSTSRPGRSSSGRSGRSGCSAVACAAEVLARCTGSLVRSPGITDGSGQDHPARQPDAAAATGRVPVATGQRHLLQPFLGNRTRRLLLDLLLGRLHLGFGVGVGQVSRSRASCSKNSSRSAGINRLCTRSLIRRSAWASRLRAWLSCPENQRDLRAFAQEPWSPVAASARDRAPSSGAADGDRVTCATALCFASCRRVFYKETCLYSASVGSVLR